MSNRIKPQLAQKIDDLVIKTIGGCKNSGSDVQILLYGVLSEQNIGVLDPIKDSEDIIHDYFADEHQDLMLEWAATGTRTTNFIAYVFRKVQRMSQKVEESVKREIPLTEGIARNIFSSPGDLFNDLVIKELVGNLSGVEQYVVGLRAEGFQTMESNERAAEQFGVSLATVENRMRKFRSSSTALEYAEV